MKQEPVETEEEIELLPEQLADLDAALEEAERGEGMDAFEFLRQLRAGTWRDPGDSATVDLVATSDSDDKKYDLTPEDEDALEESVAEIARGESVTAEDLLANLRGSRATADYDLWPLLISDSARRAIVQTMVSEALGEELRTTFELLLETPAVGAVVPTHKRKFMRRIYLPRTEYYLYYLNSAPGIEILALWHAARRPPRSL